MGRSRIGSVRLCLVADLLVVVTGGPSTITGPGEDCLICDDPLETGDTFSLITFCGRPGISHESCLQAESPPND